MAKLKPAPQLAIVEGFDWKTERVEIRIVTPEEAERFLRHRNNYNRPLNEARATRLADDLTAGIFVFNGDTVRFDREGNLLDGQHRLFAIALANVPCKLILAFGLDPEVFDTIDVGARRTAADTVARLGMDKYRQHVAATCQWLVRWQRNDFREYLRPQKVANHEVKETLRANPDLVRSVECCISARSIANPGLLAAVHYRVACRDSDLADRLISTLIEPAGTPVDDPFFVFRDTCLEAKKSARRRDPTVTLALLVKAVNAAKVGKRVQRLIWRSQGQGSEAFPVLEV